MTGGMRIRGNEAYDPKPEQFFSAPLRMLSECLAEASDRGLQSDPAICQSHGDGRIVLDFRVSFRVSQDWEKSCELHIEERALCKMRPFG